MKFCYAIAGVIAASLTATAAAGATAAGPAPSPFRAVADRESRTGLALSDHDSAFPDVDTRTATPKWAPTAAALRDVRSLPGTTARWTDFGTVSFLQAEDPAGWVDSGLTGAPKDAARRWVKAHKSLFRLTDADVDNLELLNDAVLTGTPAHAVLFRQRFGDLMSAQDGLIMVAVRDGRIALVTSSAVGHGTLAAQPAISPAAAWLAAAKDTGHADITLANVVSTGIEHTGFATFRVPGLNLAQRARLVAFATRTDGIRPAYETIVADNTNGDLEGYTVFVDAVTGRALFRQNRVQQLANEPGPAVDGLSVDGLDAAARTPGGGQFSGAFKKGACGPLHPFNVTGSPSAIAAAVVTTPVPANVDTVVKILRGKTVVASGDTVDGPEAAAYTPGGGAPAGAYAIQICAFNGSTEGSSYQGAYTVYDGPSASPFNYPAKWKIFPANPLLASAKDVRVTGCWDTSVTVSTTKTLKDCAISFASLASRLPWDVDPRTQQSTFTTYGNNAHSASAWMAPGEGAAAPAPAPAVGAITPAEQYSPVSPTRDYAFPWTDQWRTSKTPNQTGTGCAPSSFTSPARVDIDAATANLFAMHNRMHDFAYHLGYTERNYNHQLSNFGNTSPRYENDAQVGNSQAGAVNGGGAPTFGGRDNANQLTLNDGVAPISNMYLWQPIPASFYAACTDGDYDMSVIGHEYTHAISNRMVGGPDAGIGGEQGGAMGESWSDLVALEFLNAYGYAGKSGEGKGTVGAYVTGDKLDGIRDFNLDRNPLNYADYAFDTTGAEVHADGEIWNGVQWALRSWFMKAYNSRYPSANASLQARCANGQLPADQCPGNRRWVQLIFDSFLLMPADVSMLDARDAMLAADKLRFGGKDLAGMWQVFANRGMGKGARTASASDAEPTPSFVSPYRKPATVRFNFVDEATRKPVRASAFVGRFEARVTPVADTDKFTAIRDTVQLAGGAYEFVLRGPGYGLHRAHYAFKDGQTTTLTVPLARNLASRTNGSHVSGDGIYTTELLDDTESTDWGFFGQAPVVVGRTVNPTVAAKAIKNKGVTVDLAGGITTIDRITVSAMHRPARDNGEGAADPAQSRFSTLRQFAIDVSTDGKKFTQVFVSRPDAFPGHKPRPRVPDLNFREFKLPKPVRASHVRIRVLNNQCTGNAAFLGDQDADPANNPDCRQAPQASNVTIAELQVYAARGVRGASAAPAPAAVTRPGGSTLATAPTAGNGATSNGVPAGVAVLGGLAAVAAGASVVRTRLR
ncbi:MAG: extracellular elastinolytic metalloproteinase [Frankiaceae bacterium]|nr:extracellular elastinolytic metalloproteinase [Frankiaceae bacterium]